MIEFIKTWLELKVDRRAVTALEYGLIAALIAVVIIGAVTTLGTNLSATFTTMARSSKLAGAAGQGPAGWQRPSCGESRMIQRSRARSLLVSTAGLALFGVACLQDWALRLVPTASRGDRRRGVGLRLADGTCCPGCWRPRLVLLATLLLARGWLGGADVKLFAAGALLVPQAPHPASCSPPAWPAASSPWPTRLVVRRAAPGPAGHAPACAATRLEQRRLRRRGPLPYATAIAAGAAFVLLRG